MQHKHLCYNTCKQTNKYQLECKYSDKMINLPRNRTNNNKSRNNSAQIGDHYNIYSDYLLRDLSNLTTNDQKPLGGEQTNITNAQKENQMELSPA